LRFAANEEPLELKVDEAAGLTTWLHSDRLAARGPDDRVYEFDATAGRVTFGNGVNGRVPTQGSQVLINYAVSDGEAGDVARNRQWKVTGFEGAFGINTDPVTGGAAPFGPIDQRREARRRSRVEHALVSSDDIAAAARALPLLEVARAWVLPPSGQAPRTGAVTLVVMRSRPNGKEPAQVPESRRWLAAIHRRLVTRMPLGTRLVVSAPRYAGFFINATLVADASRDPIAIKAAVVSELSKRLALVDSVAGAARKPGVPVTRRDLAAWLRAVDGVKSVALQLMRATGKDVDEIAVPRGGLPRFDLAGSTIDVQRSGQGSAS
jgi:predicted phage baseplate assembly protein